MEAKPMTPDLSRLEAKELVEIVEQCAAHRYAYTAEEVLRRKNYVVDRLRRGARCEDALVQIINVAHHTCSATAIAKATLDEDVRKETT